MLWTLHDSTGPIRSGIEDAEALGLLVSNMQHEDGPVVTHLTSEGGGLRVDISAAS